MDVSEIYNDIKVRFKSPVLVRFFTIFLIYNWDMLYAAITHYNDINGKYSFDYIQEQISIYHAIADGNVWNIMRWVIPILILILTYVKWGFPLLNEWASKQLFDSKLRIEENERIARKGSGFVRYELYERIVDQFNKLKISADKSIGEYEDLETRYNLKEIESEQKTEEIRGVKKQIGDKDEELRKLINDSENLKNVFKVSDIIQLKEALPGSWVIVIYKNTPQKNRNKYPPRISSLKNLTGHINNDNSEVEGKDLFLIVEIFNEGEEFYIKHEESSAPIFLNEKNDEIEFIIQFEKNRHVCKLSYINNRLFTGVTIAGEPGNQNEYRTRLLKVN